MTTEDWLMREVRKLTELLEKLLSKTAALTLENKEEKFKEIKETVENELKININELIKNDNDRIINMLEKEKFNLEHLELFADFILALDIKEVKIKNLDQKAMAIYKYIQKKSTTYSIILHKKIQQLTND